MTGSYSSRHPDGDCSWWRRCAAIGALLAGSHVTLPDGPQCLLSLHAYQSVLAHRGK